MKWLYKIQLRKKQEKLLFELEMDLKFLEEYKNNIVNADEDEIRDKLSEINRKEEKDAKDLLEAQNYAEILADIKVVRARYSSTKSNIKELQQYIAMLSK